MEENNVPDMRPTFDEIRKVDGNGKENQKRVMSST